MKLKTPNFSYNSKTKKFIKTAPIIQQQQFINYNKKEDILNNNLSKKDYEKKLKKLNTPEQNYLISGQILNRIRKNGLTLKASSYKRNYSFRFKAKKNLTESELKSVIFNKIRDYYKTPRDGNSANDITGFSYNSFKLPENYKFNKRVKMFDIETIESKLLNKYSENIDLTFNCVIDYLHHELKKINTKVNKNLIIKRMSEFCDINNGVSVKNFEKYMEKYHKKVKYIILSPDFECLKKYEPNYRYDLTLTFYVNNSHLYPITELKTQRYISEMLTKNIKYNFYNYFKDQEITKYNDYIYMENDNTDEEKHEEEKTYILNEGIDINIYCSELINKYNTQPEYIDLNYNTSSIQVFKHPTKNIIYEAYDDYHERKNICFQLNRKFNNEFIKFNNQSMGIISKTLLNYISDIPKSDYIEETYNYLEKYEPKPINQTLSDEKKEEILQLDFYKQYSSIFYLDFEKYEIKIPIYDFFNTVEDYDNKKLTIGEYYIEQIIYKDVKLFGCFLHYKIVEILLDKKIITKENIKKQITTKKYFNTECFKEFVKITSEFCDTENEFKKINNILNGMLKDNKIRKSRCLYTNDINTLCYMLYKSEEKKTDLKWHYDETFKYHFIKETTNNKKLTNTSSFYRTTLSCSILQTIELIDKVSEYGTVCKILTDAVYYKPFQNQTTLIKTDKKKTNILKNLGKYFYDLCEKDIYTHETADIKFIDTPIIKKNIYIDGSGGLGKTYSTIEKLKEREEDNILFTSFTNDAVSNLQQNIIKIIGYIPKNWIIRTLSRQFYNSDINKKNKCSLNFELIIVDEAITTPNKFLKILEQLNIPKIYMGDEKQLHQIFNIYQQETNIMNYFNKYCIIQIKDFVEGKARYDKKTYKILEKFKNTGKTDDLIKYCSSIEEDKIYKCNIAYTNKKVMEINKKCCDYYHKDGVLFDFKNIKEEYDDDGKLLKTKNTGNTQKYKIGINCPLRCETNNKDLYKEYGITTAWRGYIKEITKEDIILYGLVLNGDYYENRNIYINKEIIKSHFIVAYCLTSHKWQGQTITEEYAFHETNFYIKYLTRNFIYTGLSRTGDIKNIHIDKSQIHKKYNEWKPNKEFIETNTPKKLFSIYKTPDNIYTLKEDKNEFYKKIEATKNYIKIILENLNCNVNNIIKKEKDLKIMTFKPIIQQKRQPVINVYENKIKCLFYDDKDEAKYKTLTTTKKRDITETFKLILKDYPEALIKDKKNILCF